jgi:uncharacterized protein DUF2834
MNLKQIGLSVVLADFIALTAYALYQYGYVGFFEMAIANAVGVQLLADLVIALTLFLLWMVPDARARGISPVPYVALILALGSIGALAYLIRRARTEQMRVVHAAAA